MTADFPARPSAATKTIQKDKGPRISRIRADLLIDRRYPRVSAKSAVFLSAQRSSCPLPCRDSFVSVSRCTLRLCGSSFRQPRREIETQRRRGPREFEAPRDSPYEILRAARKYEPFALRIRVDVQIDPHGIYPRVSAKSGVPSKSG